MLKSRPLKPVRSRPESVHSVTVEFGRFFGNFRFPPRFTTLPKKAAFLGTCYLGEIHGFFKEFRGILPKVLECDTAEGHLMVLYCELTLDISGIPVLNTIVSYISHARDRKSPTYYESAGLFHIRNPLNTHRAVHSK